VPPEAFARANQHMPDRTRPEIGRQTFIDTIVGQLVTVSILDSHRLPKIAGGVYDTALGQQGTNGFKYALAAAVTAELRKYDSNHPLYVAFVNGTQLLVGNETYNAASKEHNTNSFSLI